MTETIQQQIVREVSAWPGVTAAPHRFGGIELRVGRRELAYRIHDVSDVARVIALFRLNYERPWVGSPASL